MNPQLEYIICTSRRYIYNSNKHPKDHENLPYIKKKINIPLFSLSSANSVPGSVQDYNRYRESWQTDGKNQCLYYICIIQLNRKIQYLLLGQFEAHEKTNLRSITSIEAHRNQ